MVQDISKYSHDETLLLRDFKFYEELQEAERQLNLFSFYVFVCNLIKCYCKMSMLSNF